ncbi:MAG TPA: ribosome biogenesis GTP-binding protein YihA/YsxC [Aquabacterium sp.]|uniref:ribosome biogenesis GTP-binding protein YihA/YsxC n=1 Tax=Aquabacterium sp. TaxID=1872578 RepID=UPI002E330272|nr:ribosome biogenesis GTP-binding protein YihA/YsxC [Aquabacterium sp.]HEX5357775.1 ribosome biogenesis GTP-binding protein YihA/YsxC [Aquabacterium sp.]
MTRPSATRPKRPQKDANPGASAPANTTSDKVSDPEKEALAWAHSARFFTTAAQLNQLPVTELPEVAFVGRSNAGKSTAINTLAQQRQLAFASKTPGRTQHINLFHVGPKAAPNQVWTDLPGYGYAAVERSAKLRWQEVMANYLALRRNLTAVVQMVDSRHGFTELDRNLLEFVTPRVRNGEVKLLVLLTKADKLNRKEGAEALRQAQDVLADLATEEADIGIALFSSLKKIGVGDAAQMLKEWAATPELAQALAAAHTAPEPDLP